MDTNACIASSLQELLAASLLLANERFILSYINYINNEYVSACIARSVTGPSCARAYTRK